VNASVFELLERGKRLLRFQNNYGSMKEGLYLKVQTRKPLLLCTRKREPVEYYTRNTFRPFRSDFYTSRSRYYPGKIAFDVPVAVMRVF